jgi:exopolyphosphatase/guanosine-5'-triphosphate,3'-diphosphate pyrophosphatase
MVVARLSHGQPKVIDRLREMVRLAAGAEQEPVALECLARFGERIRDMQADSVRVVGTNALREMGRRTDFVHAAEENLGHPVEIISGIEEARLIYQGVVHTSPAVAGKQFVVDIGGGSTEIISGEGFEPETMESLDIGCVGLSEDCFGGGKLNSSRFERARLAARLELNPIRARFSRAQPERAIGASGTIRAVQAVLSAGPGEPEEITVTGLEKLIRRMATADHIDKLKLPGLSDQRKPVFPGGVAILMEVMSALDIDVMNVSDGALREGLLYDMVGRLSDEDARDRTVRSMEGRFNIDVEQADRVESTALRFLDEVGRTWKINDALDRHLLTWAARLHEIGLHISHTRYHGHGAYLLEHADMPGFPTEEQEILARLVAGHRGKFDRKSMAPLPAPQARRIKRLTVLLRLAVLFNRSRTRADLSEISFSAKGRRFTINFSGAWLDSNRLTWADLEREQKYLLDAGIELKLIGLPDRAKD